MIQTSKWTVPIVGIDHTNLLMQPEITKQQLVYDFVQAFPTIAGGRFDNWAPTTVTTQLGVKVVISVPLTMDCVFALTTGTTSHQGVTLRRRPTLRNERHITTRLLTEGIAVTDDVCGLYSLLARRAILKAAAASTVGAANELAKIETLIEEYPEPTFIPSGVYAVRDDKLFVAGTVGVLSIFPASETDSEFVHESVRQLLNSFSDAKISKELQANGASFDDLTESELRDARIAFASANDEMIAQRFATVYSLSDISTSTLTGAQQSYLSDQGLRLVASPSLVLDILSTSDEPVSVQGILALVGDACESVANKTTGHSKNAIMPAALARSVPEALVQLGVNESLKFLSSLDVFYHDNGGIELITAGVAYDELEYGAKSALHRVHPSMFKLMYPEAVQSGDTLTFQGVTVKYGNPLGRDAVWVPVNPDVFWETYMGLINTVYAWVLAPDGDIFTVPATLRILGVEGVQPSTGFAL